jgi:excinuclease ABC subunit C
MSLSAQGYEKLLHLTPSPGCYLMYQNQTVIYVGKAKNLKNRVNSYFHSGNLNSKTEQLVAHVTDFKTILTDSEKEALILEINLIKQYRPKYNILLMDDKTYPFIIFTKEKNPRLFTTRNPHLYPQDYCFGPYPLSWGASEMVNLINELFHFRHCARLKKSRCIYYDLHKCAGQCFLEVDEKEAIAETLRYLRGNVSSLIKYTSTQFVTAIQNHDVDLAKRYGDLTVILQQTASKQKIFLHKQSAVDFVSYATNEIYVCLNILIYRDEVLVNSFKQVLPYLTDPAETVMNYLVEYYHNKIEGGQTIYLDTSLDLELFQSVYPNKGSYPPKGDKSDLVLMSQKNAQENLRQYMIYQHHDFNPGAAWQELEQLIGKSLTSVESIDNSHFNLETPVSAVIVLEQGEFVKSKYRKYHLKTKAGDDLKSMYEVLYRRYFRFLSENIPFPDLLLVDGGLLQVQTAEQLMLDLNLPILVGGLVKDDHHHLRGLIFQGEEYHFEKTALISQLLINISEEVHRFTIGFQIKTRKKTSINSYFDQIDSIGETTKQILLTNFGSYDEIKNVDSKKLKTLGLTTRQIKKLKEALDGTN